MASRPGSSLVALLAIAMVSGFAEAQEDLLSIIEATSSPVFTSYEAALNGFTDDVVMVRQEVAFRQLSRISSSNPELDEFRRDLLSDYSSCNDTLREMRRLNSNFPDIEGVVSRTIAASPALYKAVTATEEKPAEYDAYDKSSANELVEKVVGEIFKAGYNAYQASEQRAAYKTGYQKARRHASGIETLVGSQIRSPAFTHYGIGCAVDFSEDGLIAVVGSLHDDSPAERAGLQPGDILISANGTVVSRETFPSAMGLSRVLPGKPLDIRLRRNGHEMRVSVERTMQIVKPLLQVDLNGSADGWLTSDLVYAANQSGIDLTNVILFVDLKGRHGDSASENSDRHMHFVKSWPKGETRVFRYMSTATSDIASDESVDQINSIQFRIYSDQFFQTENYQYTAEEFRDDVGRYLKETAFSGSWHNYPDGHLLFNSGIKVQTTNGCSFPATKATVTAWTGDASRSYTFDISGDVFDGEEYFSHSGFNGMNVTRVEVRFHLPYTDYKLEPYWTW